jgi:hypothetical protein
MKAQWIRVNTRILCALFLRVFFLAGFVSGDDSSYARNALVSTHGQYPPLCEVCVFGFTILLPSLLSIYLMSPMPYTHVITSHGEKVI